MLLPACLLVNWIVSMRKEIKYKKSREGMGCLVGLRHEKCA